MKKCIVLIIVLAIVFIFGGIAFGQVLLSEDWETGLIDSSKWDTGGSPTPVIHSGGHNSNYALDHNGNSWCHSAAHTKTWFSTGNGLVAEFWLKPYECLGCEWSTLSAGFTDLDLVDSASCGGENWYKQLISVQLQSKTADIYYQVTGIGTLFSEDYPDYDWHKYKIEINTDGYVSFYRDDQLKATSNTPIDLNTYSSTKFQVWGQACYGAMLIDDITIEDNENVNIWLDNNEVTVYEVPYALNNPDEELAILFSLQSLSHSFDMLFMAVTGVHAYWSVFTWYKFALDFFDIITDPIRIVPIGKTSDPIKYNGNPAIEICDTGSVSAIIFLDFAGTGSDNWDMSRWETLYLRIWSSYNLGTIFDEKVLLTSEQMRALDHSKSYIVVPKVTLDTGKIEGSPKPWLRAIAKWKNYLGLYNTYEGEVIILFSDTLCVRVKPWIPLLLLDD